MSKIIDSLQKRFGTQAEAESLVSTGAPADRPSRQHIHEQLADVYFQGPKPAIADEAHHAYQAPTVVRVVDRSRSYFLPWVITLAAFAISTLTLFSGKRIAIDVTISDAAAPAQARTAPLSPPAPAAERTALPAALPDRLSGEAAVVSPSEFIFSGAALLRSSRERQQLVLTNSSVSGLAYAHAVFNPAVDGLRNRLYLEARGMKGGERFEVVLKDAAGNTSLNWRPIVPFADGLTTEWEPALIEFEPTRLFDPSAIQQLRIEFGTERTGNAADATLMIRGLQWIPAESANG